MRPLGRFVELLTPDEMSMLHDRALDLLADPGMRIEDERILQALARQGASVDLARLTVRFPRQLVESTIELARQEEAARLAGGHSEQDAANALTFSWHTAYASRTPPVQVSLGGGCPFYYDYPAGRSRYATASDFLRLVHLGEGLPEVTTVGNAVHYLREDDGSEVPPKLVAIKGAAIVAKHSSKPGCTAIIDWRQLEFLMEIGIIVRGSAEEYIRRPIFVNISDTETPLRVTRPEAAIIYEMARRGLSIFILPMPLAGITGPVHPIANAIIGAAEILGVWTATKAVNERAPVEAAIVSGVLNPKTGTACFSAPEAVLQDVAVAQLFRERYGCRCGTGAGIIDAPVPGPTAIYERMLKGFGSSLAGEPAYHVGILGGGLVFSPEMLMIDLDIARAQHTYARGLGGEHFDQALDLIRERGIGGSFIDTEHTARHFRECLWMPSLFERAKGGEAQAGWDDPVAAAYESWQAVLRQTPEFNIAPEKARAIDKVVLRAQQALASIQGAAE